MTEEFEKIIGYQFKKQAVLVNALTHSSYANEMKNSCGSNERLEFLGDAVLGVVTAEYLYFHNARVPEGELTRLRAMMVCEKSLHASRRAYRSGNSCGWATARRTQTGASARLFWRTLSRRWSRP